MSGLLVLLAMPASAGAYVYWTNEEGTSIGRAELNGSNPTQNFISTDNGPCGVAINDTHIFWANFDDRAGTTIGRANLDGSNPDPAFITVDDSPCGVAVDATHIYWANFDGNMIGRANLDGTDPVQNFITGADNPCGVAVTDTHVFWANYDNDQDGANPDTIGRAELGNPAGANQSFITSAGYPCGVAVNSTHLFWATSDGGVGDNGTIGRAALDNPAGADQNFITTVTGPDTCGVAVNETHIYWGDDNGTDVGRANVDGTNPSPSFIPGAAGPCGIAVEPDCDADGLGDLSLDSNLGSCHPRTLTLDANKNKVKKRKKVTLSGQLAEVVRQACLAGQTVELQRKKPNQSSFTTIVQLQTDASGAFSAKRKVKKTFEYRAQVAETATCGTAVSNTEKVKVKKKKKKKK